MEDVGTFVLDLTNAEGASALEPDCSVEFFRLDGVAVARADHLQFPPVHRFALPAFPQGKNLHCTITPSLYRPLQSAFFTLASGEVRNQSAIVMRDAARWQPRFTAYDTLAADFGPLKKTIENKLVKLKHGKDVGVVTNAVYDSLSAPALVLAKMALLNLFTVLSAEKDPVSGKPWFDFVSQILVIDQERFTALVKPGLYASVGTILKRIGDFRKQGFFPGESSLHLDNFPSEYTLTAPLISVKSTYEQGNVQFTLAKARNDAGDCILLDCDMDENSNLFLHAGDLFKHAFTGGTNPIDIHEYIVNLQKGVDLGYQLEPRGGAVEPLLTASAANSG